MEETIRNFIVSRGGRLGVEHAKELAELLSAPADGSGEASPDKTEGKPAEDQKPAGNVPG